jgi:hypothetical protein
LVQSKVSEDEPADANRSPPGCDTVTGEEIWGGIVRIVSYIRSKHTARTAKA